MLITEMMEKVFEFKLLRREEDIVGEGLDYMRSETIENEYTPKAMRIKSQSIHTQIKRIDEKILQETITDIDFKTDKYGNITEQTVSMDTGVGKVEKQDPIPYIVKYDDKKNLLYSIAKTTRFSQKANDFVACDHRTAYRYDENGKIKMIINDCIADKNEKETLDEMNFIQTILVEYNEDGMVSSIDFTDIDRLNVDYNFSRFIVNYAPGGYIENIHRVGTDAKCDEYFQYYENGTVVVVKNTYNADDTVIGKVSLTYKIN